MTTGGDGDNRPSGEAALSALSDLTPKLTVELHPSGRMRAPHPGARELLRDRLRNAELMPCGPGWLVLRTRGESTSSIVSDPREVVAAGVIGPQGLSVVDFIGFLENGDETGVLTVAHEDLERSLFLREGSVVWATSTQPAERLDGLLVLRGRITQEQLNLLRQDPTAQGQIGLASVERGFTTADDMGAMMRAQLVEVFDQILAMEEGIWSFARLPSELLALAPVQLSAQGMLMDSLRRMDEMQVYRQRVRSASVMLQRVPKAPRGAAPPSAADLVGKLDPPVQNLAAMIMDALLAPTTISDLMRRTGGSEYETTRAAYQLLRADLVELGPDQPQSRAGPAVAPALAKEMIHVYSMAIREVFDDVARIGQSNSLRAAMRGYLADEEGTGMYAGLLQNVVVLPDGTLEEESVLRGIAANTATASALGDALGEILFFVLYQATELLGRRRGDDLARRVRMIHSMLTPQAETP